MAIPATTWQPQPQNQEGDYTLATAVDIVDPNGNYLVDPSANNIIDTAQTYTGVASTVWVVDDSNE